MNPVVILINLFLFISIITAIYWVYKLAGLLFKNVDNEIAIKDMKNDIKENAELSNKIVEFEKKHRDIVNKRERHVEIIRNFINNGKYYSNNQKGDVEGKS